MRVFVFTIVLIFQSCFAYLRFIHLKNNIQMKRNVKLCYPDDEDGEFNNKKNKNNMVSFNQHDYNKEIYTLVWYDCPKCKELLEVMSELKLQHNYINGGYYFFDTSDINSEFNSPLFYKDDEFIGDNLFDIYCEIYDTL